MSTRIRNAAQLVVVCSNGEKLLKGEAQNKINIIKNGTMIIDSKGLIIDIGEESELSKKYEGQKFEVDLDATGKSVIPGFCDGHTHPVWSGDRCHEFSMKLQGATYMDIHNAGGGIGYTVKCVRKSSKEELSSLLSKRLDIMISNGTTLVEAKSGYGLNFEAEIKMLEVLHEIVHPIDIVSNYLGAHSIPKNEKNLQEYTKEIVEVHIPEILRLKNENKISPEFIDVFHEKGVFETKETLEILKKGQEIGLSINFHGDELNCVESGLLAKDLNVTAISHLEKINDEEIDIMSKKEVIGTLLPTTAYVLNLEFPPARKMIEKNVPICLGSDFNPNAHCMSMPFVMNLACFIGDTLIRMYNGNVKKIQDIKMNDEVLGPDLKKRTVINITPRNVVDVMYHVIENSLHVKSEKQGLIEFICNSEHQIVLYTPTQPSNLYIQRNEKYASIKVNFFDQKNGIPFATGRNRLISFENQPFIKLLLDLKKKMGKHEWEIYIKNPSRILNEIYLDGEEKKIFEEFFFNQDRYKADIQTLISQYEFQQKNQDKILEWTMSPKKYQNMPETIRRVTFQKLRPLNYSSFQFENNVEDSYNNIDDNFGGEFYRNIVKKAFSNDETKKKFLNDCAWLFGCWIGDGYSMSLTISLDITDEDEIDKVHDVCKNLGLQAKLDKDKGRMTLNTLFSALHRGKCLTIHNPFWELIKRYGMGEKTGKILSKSFSLEPLEIRQFLLAGLLDSDGYNDKKRKLGIITTIYSDVRDGLIDLSRSLAIPISISVRTGYTDSNEVNHQTCYSCSLSQNLSYKHCSSKCSIKRKRYTLLEHEKDFNIENEYIKIYFEVREIIKLDDDNNVIDHRQDPHLKRKILKRENHHASQKVFFKKDGTPKKKKSLKNEFCEEKEQESFKYPYFGFTVDGDNLFLLENNLIVHNCVKMKMTMNEALVAATINSAASMNRSKTHGSLEIGKFGDCVIIDSNNWEHVIYELVNSPITHVIKKGKIVYENNLKINYNL